MLDPGEIDAALVPTPRWGVLRRVTFRFVLLYFGLYYLSFPLTVFGALAQLPPPLSWIGTAAGWLAQAYGRGLGALGQWTGSHLLGLAADAMPIQPTGSGDTMVDYVQAFTGLALALAGTVLWSIADRRRPTYARLAHALHVYLRYALATVLLTYGLSKIPPLQFPKPGPELLVQTYGDSSPMGLLWRFMGFSPAYTMFAGLAELLPGVLLLFRRTSALGALIAVATMTNVVMLNFCYDVPVKLYSAHLLVTAILILAPDASRLARAILCVGPAPRLRRTQVWLKSGFLVVLFTTQLFAAYTGWKEYGPSAEKPALCGVWQVESFTLDGELRPPLLTDTARWRRFLVSRWGGAIVEQMGQQVNRYTMTHDETTGTITLASRGGPDTFQLTCRRPEPGRLVLEGPFREGLVRVELKRADDAIFPIDSRGFHWVQEFPYNR